MIIVIRKDAGKDKLEKLQNWLKACGVTPHVSVGERQTIVGCIGDVSQIDEGRLSAMTDVVASIKRIQEPYKAVNRQFHPQDTVVEIPVKDGPPLKIGGGNFQVIAGPCSVESEEQVVAIARAVKAAGADMLTRDYALEHGLELVEYTPEQGGEMIAYVKDQNGIALVIWDEKEKEVSQRIEEIRQAGISTQVWSTKSGGFL